MIKKLIILGFKLKPLQIIGELCDLSKSLSRLIIWHNESSKIAKCHLVQPEQGWLKA